MSRKRRNHDHYVVYRATNTQNNKSYVGQSYDFESRKRQHIADAYGKHKNRQAHAFQNAIAKYGEDKFTWTILAEFDNVDDCNKAEEALITELNTLAPNGYNLHPGGRNKTPALETRKKISETLKRVGTILSNKGPAHPNYGRVYTEKEKKHFSEIHSGEKGAGAKLTTELVKQIYMEVYNGATGPDTARKYGLNSHTTVCNIMHKRSWKKELADLPTYTAPTPEFASPFGSFSEKEILVIYNKAIELGIFDPPKKYKKEKRQAIHKLAAEYNVPRATIFNILRGRRYKRTFQKLKEQLAITTTLPETKNSLHE